jgi:hypothetical protein
MRYIWDLDNTLVHTREAALQAYLFTGTTPPDNFHTRPWQTWCSPEDRELKERMYPTMLLQFARPTPLFDLWKVKGGPIITNTAPTSVDVLRRMLPELNDVPIGAGMDPTSKVEYLQILSGDGLTGVYVDDSAETCRRVREETKWQAMQVQF